MSNTTNEIIGDAPKIEVAIFPSGITKPAINIKDDRIKNIVLVKSI